MIHSLFDGYLFPHVYHQTPIPTTSFNKIIFQSAATGNTTITILYYSNKQSSNKYHDNVELILDY